MRSCRDVVDLIRSASWCADLRRVHVSGRALAIFEAGEVCGEALHKVKQHTRAAGGSNNPKPHQKLTAEALFGAIKCAPAPQLESNAAA